MNQHIDPKRCGAISHFLRRALLLTGVAPLLGVMALACGGQETEPTAANVSSTTTAEAEPSPQAAAPSYEVHEWGLIDVHGTSYELAAGPGDPQPATTATAPVPPPAMRPGMRPPTSPGPAPTMRPQMGRRKPVLYFHRNGEGPLSVTVTVSGAGQIAEHWPPAELSGTGVTWRDVIVSDTSHGCSGLTYPARDSAQCASAAGGYCELADLAGYEATDGACLGFGGASWDHLFYRGTGEGPTLPVAVSRDGDRVTVRSTATQSPVGAAYYVRRGAAGQPVLAAQLALGAPGTSATFGAPSVAGTTAVRSALGAALREGLTEAEALAFERAWFGELFEAGETGGAPVVRDAVIYVLPEPHVASFSRLELDPAPQALRRMFWVRVDVTPN